MATPLHSAKEGLSVREVSERLGVSYQTVHNWIKAGQLPCTRFGPTGRKVRIAEEDLAPLIRTG